MCGTMPLFSTQTSMLRKPSVLCDHRQTSGGWGSPVLFDHFNIFADIIFSCGLQVFANYVYHGQKSSGKHDLFRLFPTPLLSW